MNNALTTLNSWLTQYKKQCAAEERYQNSWVTDNCIDNYDPMLEQKLTGVIEFLMQTNITPNMPIYTLISEAQRELKKQREHETQKLAKLSQHDKFLMASTQARKYCCLKGLMDNRYHISLDAQHSLIHDNKTILDEVGLYNKAFVYLNADMFNMRVYSDIEVSLCAKLVAGEISTINDSLFDAEFKHHCQQLLMKANHYITELIQEAKKSKLSSVQQAIA